MRLVGQSVNITSDGRKELRYHEGLRTCSRHAFNVSALHNQLVLHLGRPSDFDIAKGVYLTELLLAEEIADL